MKRGWTMMQRIAEAGRIGVEAYGAPPRLGAGGLVGSGGGALPGRDDAAPASAEDFACKAILAICGTGVSPAVGRRAYERCRIALEMGATVRMGFRHPGKADAIDRIWRDRHSLHRAYVAAADKLAVLDALPWVGPVTKRGLARSLGLFDEGMSQAAESFKAAA